MSSYFDYASSEITAISLSHPDNDGAFVNQAKHIEARVVRDCLALICDFEFPSDLRDEGLVIIRKYYEPSSLEPNAYLRCTRSSQIIQRLHDFFHTVGRRKVKTRFGVIFDNPAEALRLRLDQVLKPGDFE